MFYFPPGLLVNALCLSLYIYINKMYGRDYLIYRERETKKEQMFPWICFSLIPQDFLWKLNHSKIIH